MITEAERLKGLSQYCRFIPADNPVRMDLNENCSKLVNSLVVSADEIRRYPDEEPLKKVLSESWGVGMENILLFNGASEAIMCGAFALINPGEKVAVTVPEFFLIPHYLKLAGGKILEIPLTCQMDFNPEAIEQALATGVRAFFVSIPHNPSGAILSEDRILRWCRKWKQTLFAVDEAYASFAGRSLLSRAPLLSNLLVIKSFSKDSAMAGLRLGAVTGCRELIESVGKVRTPYSVNAAALKAVLTTANATGEDDHCILNQDLATLSEETEKAGFKVKRGKGNFFLILGDCSTPFFEHCLRRGVVLRKLNSFLVRVSPSDSPGNAKYLKCLEEWREINEQSSESNS